MALYLVFYNIGGILEDHLDVNTFPNKPLHPLFRINLRQSKFKQRPKQMILKIKFGN